MKDIIRIGIVEDELLIAEKLKHLLSEIGYLVCEPAINYNEALELLKSGMPDLMVVDINLREKNDGIDLAKVINDKYQIPFIFLTANGDRLTVERAKKVYPHAFLLKPFTKEELYAAIEIAFSNYKVSSESIESKTDSFKEYIFIRENHRFIKLNFAEIIYVESQENYVIIHTSGKKNFIIRSTFSDFIKQLPEQLFLQTHRSFVVHLNHISKLEPTEIFADEYVIPLSNTFRAKLYKVLGIKD